jgi:hypothetical protein
VSAHTFRRSVYIRGLKPNQEVLHTVLDILHNIFDISHIVELQSKPHSPSQNISRVVIDWAKHKARQPHFTRFGPWLKRELQCLTDEWNVAIVESVVVSLLLAHGFNERHLAGEMEGKQSAVCCLLSAVCCLLSRCLDVIQAIF